MSMNESKYLVITDACNDLTPELVEKEDIRVIPMEVVMTDGRKFNATYNNSEMSLDEFYSLVEGGLMSSTTAITPQTYLDYFRPLLAAGNDILYNCFTSGMSSTYANALLAQQTLREEFPDRKLIIVDSIGATGGQGYQTYFAAVNRDNGMSIEDNAKWLEDTKHHINYTWTVSDLNHLRRGGRLSNIAAFAGTLLQLKPVGDIDDKGSLVAMGTVHGRKASITRLADILNARIDVSYDKPAYICHCACPQDAELLKQKVLETGKVKEVIMGRVGPVVGTHLGPSGLTLFYFADHRGGLK